MNDEPEYKEEKITVIGVLLIFALGVFISMSGCTTTYYEMRGECVVQEWTLGGVVMRSRRICDLPPPDADETQVRDREAMDTNPFPDLIDLKNPADSTDPNLLEKSMGYPQEEEE